MGYRAEQTLACALFTDREAAETCVSDLQYHVDFPTLVFTFDKMEARIGLTRSNWSPCLDVSHTPWCLAVAHAPISSAYLCPWVLSIVAPPAKCLHWCALNKPLRCRSARDSQKIYVTFMTFTFRKEYRAKEFSGSRGSFAHLCNDMG